MMGHSMELILHRPLRLLAWPRRGRELVLLDVFAEHDHSITRLGRPRLGVHEVCQVPSTIRDLLADEQVDGALVQ